MSLRVAVTCEVKRQEARSRSESEPEEGVEYVSADAKPGPISVEKLPDELRVGAKDQSNLEIARTPRKAFRCCLGRSPREVERPVGCEGFAACQVLSNSECARAKPWRKGAGANVRSREENNPDRRPKPRSRG